MKPQNGKKSIQGKHYRSLAVMAVLSFGAMYVLMYSMVDKITNVYSNINQIYMAGLMTAPMVAIELLIMGEMYQNKRANIAILAGSIVALIVFFALIRAQTAVSDTQFLRSMIPHHAGAILMCERTSLQDPDLGKLCKGIIASQQEEIDLMRAKLGVLGG
ncbi:MAG: DUF305 domain-containing protein [Hyphomicrobium sp.]